MSALDPGAESSARAHAPLQIRPPRFAHLIPYMILWAWSRMAKVWTNRYQNIDSNFRQTNRRLVYCAKTT